MRDECPICGEKVWALCYHLSTKHGVDFSILCAKPGCNRRISWALSRCINHIIYRTPLNDIDVRSLLNKHSEEFQSAVSLAIRREARQAS